MKRTGQKVVVLAAIITAATVILCGEEPSAFGVSNGREMIDVVIHAVAEVVKCSVVVPG